MLFITLYTVALLAAGPSLGDPKEHKADGRQPLDHCPCVGLGSLQEASL